MSEYVTYELLIREITSGWKKIKRNEKESVYHLHIFIYKTTKKGYTVVNWWTFEINLKLKTKYK